MRTIGDALSPSLTTKFDLDGWEIRVLPLNKDIEITDLPLSEKMNRAKSGTSPPILVLAPFILVSFPPFCYLRVLSHGYIFLLLDLIMDGLYFFQCKICLNIIHVSSIILET